MFQAGFSRVDVTPPLGNPLAGYPRERLADGVMDPIELCALAVNDGENTAILITGDFLYVMESAATPLRKQISERTGVPEGQILIHGIHQHTSVRLGNRTILPQSHALKDTAYLDLVARKFCDVAQMAIADLSDASLSVAEKETREPISFVRRYRMKDGSIRTFPGYLNPDIVGPEGDADNTVRLVRIRREGKKDIALVGFQTHPDVIGGNKYSADWPGFVRRFTEADLGDVHCLLINGPQGDTNHCNMFKPPIARKADPDVYEKKYAHSRKMGRIIADAVLDLWNETRPIRSDKVWGEVRMVYVPTNMKGLDQIEEMKEVKRQLDEGTLKMAPGEQVEVTRILELRDETLFQRIPVSVMGIGDLALVGFGGEPFTRYADVVRKAAPDLYVMSLCCANGGQGYLPDQTAYADGGYGVTNTRFAPDVADLTQSAAKEMMNLYKSQR